MVVIVYFPNGKRVTMISSPGTKLTINDIKIKACHILNSQRVDPRTTPRFAPEIVILDPVTRRPLNLTDGLSCLKPPSPWNLVTHIHIDVRNVQRNAPFWNLALENHAQVGDNRSLTHAIQRMSVEHRMSALVHHTHKGNVNIIHSLLLARINVNDRPPPPCTVDAKEGGASGGRRGAAGRRAAGGRGKERSPVPRESFLMMASREGHRDVVALLLRAGACVNEAPMDEEKRTCLMAASAHGHTHVVKLLLEHGGNANQVDVLGRSSLTEACAYGHEHIVSLLLNTGCAHANAETVYGTTALHYALESGSAAVVALILDAQGDPNHPIRREGEIIQMNLSPLMYSAMRGHTRICELLLEARAEVNARDTTGWSSLAYAVYCQRKDTAEMLKSREAKLFAII